MGRVGSLRLPKRIGFTKFTFDSHAPCNFRKKQVTRHAIFVKKTGHRIKWARFARKKELDSPSLHLTLIWHTIFVKKQVTGADGLASLARKDWIHLVYI